MLDRRGRPLGNLRVSVTDRCNLRCQYCMPEEHYQWLRRADTLDFDEIATLVGVFARLGTSKVRVTGGEPLLRRDVDTLVARLVADPAVSEVAMTTNGVLLADHAERLKAAGLRRVTVSVDTLDPAVFEKLARRRSHGAVVAGIAALADAGFRDTKIDTVVIRGVNEGELCDLIEFGRRMAAEVRFIEFMDVGGATGWSARQVYSRSEMLADVAAVYGGVRPLEEDSSAPADRFVLPDGTVFGVISSTTAPFCAACDRSRLTADGMWYRCLYALGGTDLRTPLRDGASAEELSALVAGTWRARSDQGAVDRLSAADRAPLADAVFLKDNPHLEMHTRGG